MPLSELLDLIKAIELHSNCTIALSTLIYTLMTGILVYQSWRSNRLSSNLFYFSQRPVIKVKAGCKGNYMSLSIENVSSFDAFSISVRRRFSIKGKNVMTLYSGDSVQLDLCCRDDIKKLNRIIVILKYSNDLGIPYRTKIPVEVPVELRRT